MKRFVEGKDRTQGVLLPEFLDDYVAEDNPVRAIEVFVDELDLRGLGFDGVVPEETGRPAYHPATMLKIYVHGYVNQVQSSRLWCKRWRSSQLGAWKSPWIMQRAPHSKSRERFCI